MFSPPAMCATEEMVPAGMTKIGGNRPLDCWRPDLRGENRCGHMALRFPYSCSTKALTPLKTVRARVYSQGLCPACQILDIIYPFPTSLCTLYTVYPNTLVPCILYTVPCTHSTLYPLPTSLCTLHTVYPYTLLPLYPVYCTLYTLYTCLLYTSPSPRDS